ncbi:MAG: hypothetical protein ACE5EK_04050 [Nitrospinales bacterium]
MSSLTTSFNAASLPQSSFGSILVLLVLLIILDDDADRQKKRHRKQQQRRHLIEEQIKPVPRTRAFIPGLRV